MKSKQKESLSSKSLYNQKYTQQYNQYGGSLPTWTYIILIVFGIIIVYLLVLRSRINEFFENKNNGENNTSNKVKKNNTPSDVQPLSDIKNTNDNPDDIYIKQEINPYEIQLIWQGQLPGNNRYLSIWQRKNKPSQNMTSMGQYATITNNKIDGLSMEEIKDNGILNMLVKGGKYPLKYIKIWSSDTIVDKKPHTDISIWQPIPPNGYSVLGDIVVPSLSKPTRDKVICIPNKYLTKNGQFKTHIYQNSFGPDNILSIWKVGNYGAFFVNQANNKPIMRTDDIKDLTQDLLNKKEYDTAEIHSGVQVILSTRADYIPGKSEE